jgi:hypothetical protein
MSTYSPDLRIELITTGDQAGTWGATTNTNLAYVVEQAIAGYVSVSVTSTNQAFTYLNGGSATAALNQSVFAVIALTTTTGAAFNVYAPPVSKQYVIYNASAYSATIYNSTVLGNTTAAGAGVVIPAGKTMTIWSEGTNFYLQNTHIIGTVVGNVTGNLTGNVTGNVTGNINGVVTGTAGSSLVGNVTGNVTGNLTGNVTGNTSGSSGSLATSNFSIVESGGKLYFKYGATNIASMDSSGNITSLANITAYGTP